jgi:hypothetical protein
MASLSDLQGVYQPDSQETGFRLADIERAGQQAATGAEIGRERLLRNFSKFDLPNLLSAQGARGAFRSSATGNKREQLATGVQDQLGDIELGLANTQADLAANALVAQAGIQLGGQAY